MDILQQSANGKGAAGQRRHKGPEAILTEKLLPDKTSVTVNTYSLSLDFYKEDGAETGSLPRQHPCKEHRRKVEGRMQFRVWAEVRVGRWGVRGRGW